jgi:hypothetical protein
MGELTVPLAGRFVRLPDGIYYVDYVTGSGAHLIPMSGRPGKIRTNPKRTKKPVQEKEVFRHPRRFIVISNSALVEEVDPKKLDQRLMRRRIEMAKIEDANATPETGEAAAAPEASNKTRATQSYRLTNKAPKETMKGQGKLVYDTLKEMGGTATVGALTEAVRATGQLQTRQDAERVVGFYCSKFKREGIVEAVRPEVSQEQAVAAAV